MKDDFSYEIVKELGTISEYGKYAVRVNIISFNGNPAKLDIRKWNTEENKMMKGIALNDDEAKELKKILEQEYK